MRDWRNVDWDFHFANIEKAIHARTRESDRENARISLGIIRRAVRETLSQTRPRSTPPRRPPRPASRTTSLRNSYPDESLRIETKRPRSRRRRWYKKESKWRRLI
jgi:hypothetical protein